MSPVLTRPRPQSAPALFRRDVLILVLAGAIAITALAGIQAALRGPEFVDRVTVVNETPYLVDIEVTSDTRDGWLGLGPVSPGASHNFGSVIDQGERWIFHVTAGPYDGGEFSLSKSELQERWRVTIPRDVQQRLEALGAVPLPDR
jgi:hypothetical protein